MNNSFLWENYYKQLRSLTILVVQCFWETGIVTENKELREDLHKRLPHIVEWTVHRNRKAFRISCAIIFKSKFIHSHSRWRYTHNNRVMKTWLSILYYGYFHAYDANTTRSRTFRSAPLARRYFSWVGRFLVYAHLLIESSKSSRNTNGFSPEHDMCYNQKCKVYQPLDPLRFL